MKHIHRFFVSRTLKTGDAACLEADDSFHAGRVLRLSRGDRIELADADGNVFAAEITHTDGKVGVRAVELLEEAGARQGLPRLTVVQAVPSGKKMDLIVEKLSELGVYKLVPVYSDGSIFRRSRKGDGGSGGKLERWRRIARSAAAQSKRSGIMEVTETAALADWLSGSAAAGILVLSTEVEGAALGDVVKEQLTSVLPRQATGRETDGQPPRDVQETALVVGPESGFCEDELAALAQAGARFATLGAQVLRTETAALVAAAIVMHRMGALG